MEIPYFYEENITEADSFYELSPETSNHCVRVLRMQQGDNILITNGKGVLFNAVFEKANKQRSIVRITAKKQSDPVKTKVSIGISPLKNSGRMEWFLEKATEIGVKEIRLLTCERTERSYFKAERFKNIMAGALIQSRQTHLPELVPPQPFSQVIQEKIYLQKLIAHCMEDEKIKMREIRPASSIQILIGPEGDFTAEEVALALHSGFQPVSLGKNRLRTETAGLVAAALLLI